VSAEHKRPLYAFVVLTLLCGVLLGKAMRTDALPGLLLGPAGSVIAAQAILDDLADRGQHEVGLDDPVVLAAGKRFSGGVSTEARAIERKAIESPGKRAIERKAIESPGKRAIERKAIEGPGKRAIERPGTPPASQRAIERSSEKSAHHRPTLRRTPPAHAKRPAQHPGKGHAKGHGKGKAKGKAVGHRR
jgi:hypothetical protein